VVDLIPRMTSAATVQPTPGGGFLLTLPEGDSSRYVLAQLDDYMDLPRGRFAWTPPTTLRLHARLTATRYAGTWGFGFWNDPFSASLGVGGAARRLPVLPNAAWFFFASPENHLALDDGLPGHGLLAQALSSPRIPPVLLGPGLLAAPFLLVPKASRSRRRIAASIIRSDAKKLELDYSEWQEYQLEWGPGRVLFAVGGQTLFASDVSPSGPLGLVIWLDNQFAAWRPDGGITAGRLANEAAVLEIEQLSVESGQGARGLYD
jgi:hypothetical protein